MNTTDAEGGTHGEAVSTIDDEGRILTQIVALQAEKTTDQLFIILFTQNLTIMKKIKLALSALSVKELFTLGLRIKEIVASRMTEEMGINFYFNAFLLLLDQYATAMQKASISAEQLQLEDSGRDNLWIALRSHIYNFMRHPDAAISAIAKSLLHDMDKQGDRIYDKSYSTETAAIENVIALFDNRTQDLQDIKADEWYTLLKEKQAAFESDLQLYDAAKTDNKQQEAAYSLRPTFIESIDKLFNFLPMQAEITDNADLQDIVNLLQTEADRF